MNKNELIAKIKAEIERRKSLLTQHSKLTYDLILETFIKEYDDLLSFISTLESENPLGEEYAIEIGKYTHTLRIGSQSDIDNLIRQEKQEQPEVDLEKEYKEYVENDPVYRKLVNRNAGLSIARHFAEWGAEHLADARKTSPKDLEEAIKEAEEFAEGEWDGLRDNDGNALYTEDMIRYTFVEAVKWHKEQMMDEWLKDRDGCFWDGVEEGKKAMEKQMMEKAVEVEGVAVWQYLDNHGRDFYKVETEDFTTHGEICEGDKVKVIIVKEGEK